jgi:hypothetical protein
MLNRAERHGLREKNLARTGTKFKEPAGRVL